MGIIIVGGVVEKDGKYLLVQEAKEKCRGKWNTAVEHGQAAPLNIIKTIK